MVSISKAFFTHPKIEIYRFMDCFHRSNFFGSFTSLPDLILTIMSWEIPVSVTGLSRAPSFINGGSLIIYFLGRILKDLGNFNNLSWNYSRKLSVWFLYNPWIPSYFFPSSVLIRIYLGFLISLIHPLSSSGDWFHAVLSYQFI